MCYVPVSGVVSCLADDVRRFAFVFTIQPGQAIRNMSTCSPIGVAGIVRHSYTLCTTHETQLRNARCLFGCRTFASLILTVLSTNAPAAAKGVKKRYASTVGADIQAPNYQGGGVWGRGAPYSIRLGDLGERRELLQWVPGRKRWWILKPKKQPRHHFDSKTVTPKDTVGIRGVDHGGLRGSGPPLKICRGVRVCFDPPWKCHILSFKTGVL